MNTTLQRQAGLALLLLLTMRLPILCAANVSAKVIDKLGRPVANVVLDVHWLKSVSKDDVRSIPLVKLVSDKNGLAKGKYDETAIPQDEHVWVEISKPGYVTYSSSELDPEFVLKRKFDDADLARIAGLDGRAQVDEVREVLAGSFGDSGYGLDDCVFVHEQKFRPPLRALVSDPHVGISAGQLLAFIGVPDDIRHFLEHAPAPKPEPFENRWAYRIASALLEPATEKEWEFLRNCAANEYDDLWVDAGAIQTLKLIALPRCRQILEEVEARNETRADLIEGAIKYIESKPLSFSDLDLVIAGNQVAQAIKTGKWRGNKPPRFNENGDKALVECEFIEERCEFIYTATFHKIDGVWRLRGVRETMQGLLAGEPEKEARPDAKK
jgi:hypothetical protein